MKKSDCDRMLPLTIIHSTKASSTVFQKSQIMQAALLLSFALALTVSPFSGKAQDNHTPTNLGPFELQQRTDNPIREPFSNNFRPTPVAIDYDRDGDIDVVVADYYGGNGFQFLRNDGTETAPAFNRAVFWDNPFEYLEFPLASTPSFHDVDNDGDFDMLVGTEDGRVLLYKFIETSTISLTLQNTPWNAETKTGNPFHGLDLGEFTSPVFIDLDNDNDKDVVIGTTYEDGKSIRCYINDGAGNYSEGELTGVNPNVEETTPWFTDVNNDDLLDLLIGAKDGNVYYFKRTGSFSFEEQTGTLNPFTGINKGPSSSPSSGDFDGDGDEDVTLGAESNGLDVFYFRNNGDATFTELNAFENPFGGYASVSKSNPLFTYVDDDGYIDLLVGNSDNHLDYLKNQNGTFKLETVSNPFSNLTIPDNFSPSYLDLDGDGDKDLLGSGSIAGVYNIEYYQNNDGALVAVNRNDGPFSTITLTEGRSDFADFDNDGDYDLVVSDEVHDDVWNSHYIVRYFENTGTANSPNFTERVDAANPFHEITEEFILAPRFVDMDHDGDLDLIIGEGGTTIENQDGNEFSYYENVGTGSNPSFIMRGDIVEQGSNPHEPTPSFLDYDNDGDLDIFMGGASGELRFYRNINTAAVITLSQEPLNTPWGTGAFIDSNLSLTDADNDSIIYVKITINSFEAGKDEFSFVAQPGIDGVFDDVNGTLTFRGKAPVTVYEQLLQSVKLMYNAEIPGGRTRNPEANNATAARSITIEISDADGTTSLTASRTINFMTNTPPVFTNGIINASFQGSQTLDLTTLINDADGNIDLTTLEVVIDAPSGAAISIDENFILTADYAGINFSGTEQITLSVCDAVADCDQSIVTINVAGNTAPQFDDVSVSTPYAGFVTVNLIALIDDTEGNVDLSTLSILAQPVSGAVATINASNVLRVEYAATNFSGTESLTLRVCDTGNACSESTITITVMNGAPVITPEPINTPQGSTKIINLLDITSDPDNNLDPESIEIISSPTSGAMASIVIISPTVVNLVLNYSGITFSGIDYITIQACDAAGECAESILAITVDVVSELEVYNAVAPNSTGDNKWLRIENLPEENGVRIFNRWGDVVFNADNYNNETKRFEGNNDSGKALPSGTYFYEIKYRDHTSQQHKTVTGYLSLKQ